MSCSLPKTDLQTNFLDSENQSFENVSFDKKELFKEIFDIFLLINLFISLFASKNTN